MRLEKIKSIDCPKCGCNDTKLVGAGERYGRPWARYACGFCNFEFVTGADPTQPGEVNGVVERPVQCPKCSSTKVPVNNTSRVGETLRRHRKCRNCGQNFYSTAPAEQS